MENIKLYVNTYLTQIANNLYNLLLHTPLKSLNKLYLMTIVIAIVIFSLFLILLFLTFLMVFIYKFLKSDSKEMSDKMHNAFNEIIERMKHPVKDLSYYNTVGINNSALLAITVIFSLSGYYIFMLGLIPSIITYALSNEKIQSKFSFDISPIAMCGLWAIDIFISVFIFEYIYLHFYI